ncbi:dihydroneopterin aldolase [Nannocystis pusilla]|uniref:dihydroneopterin aldolase n=1 Tax=Nannocystis pusilla TaxID=889268 RepID=A0ABS7TK74_9BACT|nr:dihydroneopterin aldolase [Nannocystis pusilla]MBZ5708588.1 dihydroneopterin aldolase [Nannocystis pusilla]
MNQRTGDTVYCNQLALDIEIGFHEVERGVQQTVLVDLELTTNFGRGPASDNFAGLVDYYVIANHLTAHVAGRRYALIEALAVDLAREIVKLHPEVTAKVRIVKQPLDMPRVRSVAVECVRTAADFAAEPR